MRARYQWLTHLCLILMALFSLAPFIWMVLTSMKPLVEVEQLNPIPTKWKFDNYLEVFKQIPG